MRPSPATGTSNETPAGYRNSPKDRLEATFSYILDAQSTLAVLAYASGSALEFNLGLNYLLFNASEDRSSFLQSQTQLCRNIGEALTLNHCCRPHCHRLAGNHRFHPDNKLHGCALHSSLDILLVPTF
jgi:hypothetical protein